MARAGIPSGPCYFAHMSHLRTVLAATLLLWAMGQPSRVLSAGELAAGKAKAQAVCQTCHGMDGLATMAMVPNLSGQRKDYMVIQLEAYRAGQRQHPQMSIISQMLTDDDIENVTEWYSHIKITVEPPE